MARWQDALHTALGRHGLGHVEATLHYSSWALLGQCIRSSVTMAPDWRRYADDVLYKLRLKGLLGYDGGPMFHDDLQQLTVVNAVELFNRTVKAARELLLAIHAQSRFQQGMYEPLGGRSPRMVRDGTSSTLTESPSSFETSMLLSVYRKPSWQAGTGVYVGIWLTPGEGADPHLQAGAFQADHSGELVWSYASAEDADESRSKALAGVDRTLLRSVSVTKHTEWVYADRPWGPSRANEDVEWALDALEAGSKAWDA